MPETENVARWLPFIVVSTVTYVRKQIAFTYQSNLPSLIGAKQSKQSTTHLDTITHQVGSPPRFFQKSRGDRGSGKLFWSSMMQNCSS